MNDTAASAFPHFDGPYQLLQVGVHKCTNSISRAHGTETGLSCYQKVRSFAARSVLSNHRLPHGRGDVDDDDLRNSWRGLHVNVNGRLPPPPCHGRHGDGGGLQHHNRCGFHAENVNGGFLPSSWLSHRAAGGGDDDDVNGDHLPRRPLLSPHFPHSGGGDYESDGQQSSFLYLLFRQLM